MNQMDLMIDRIIEKHNPTVAGLDTRVEYLPEEFIAELGIGAIDTMEKAAQAILAYNKRLIKALCDIVPAVKVQIAYYEMYGVAGMKAFEETLKAAHEAGMSVMVDAKRNDIGATAEAYATSYLGKTQLPAGEARAFEGDFVTVNAYLGVDGVKPFVNACEKNGGGIFALVKTSNPSSGQLQGHEAGGRPHGVRDDGRSGKRVGREHHRQARLFSGGRGSGRYLSRAGA